jgi:4-hydroxybenzoate polyprenyltransferase
MEPAPDSRPIADAPPGNWVERRAPAGLRPYLKLARADRPIGTWLLLLPGWWSVALAAEPSRLPDLWLMVAFAAGAWVMRGAGCTFNDIVDRDLDGRVERTRNRPLPSGQASLFLAVLWMILLAGIGLAILLTFNRFAVWLGAASLGLIVVYPFMKRVTWWPQAVLGMAFNWGALLGWSAARGELALAPVVLYLAGIAWTLGYDTIYAHQDKEDDALVGIKSTARLFGEGTRKWLVAFYAATAAGLALAGALAGLGQVYFWFLAAGAAHLAWQAATLDIDDPRDCLSKFRSNRDFGLVVLAGIVLAKLLA